MKAKQIEKKQSHIFSDGFNAFIEEKLPILREKNIDFLLNIAGSTVEDYEKLEEVANYVNERIKF